MQKRDEMKTIVRKTTLLALVFALALSLVGCFGGVDSSGECTVVIANGSETTEYEISLSDIEADDGLMALLRYLNENEGVELNVTNSTYGAMINSVGSVVPDASKYEYVKIYTSYEFDFDTSEYFEEMTYGGVRLGTSGLGASSMTVTDGGIYYLTLGSY